MAEPKSTRFDTLPRVVARHHVAHPLLRVQTVEDGDRARVVVHGELDLATSPELTRDVLALLERGTDEVTIDLGALEFIDSSGVAALLTASAAARARNATCTLRAVPAQARRVLELTGLADRFVLG